MSLASQLLRSARSYAGQLTSLARSYAPKHLQAGIKTSVVEESPGLIRMTITSKGADAHAQEYGSGIHGERRAKKKYPITPKTGKYLAFNWQIHPEGARYLPDGRILLESVQHPGINKYEGRGYIRPAVRQFTKNLKENPKIKDEIRDAILSDLTKAFNTGVRK